MKKPTPHHQKESVALSSVLAGFVLTAGKLVVGLLTGSMGILSEAAHSLLDWAAAIMTFFAVRYGDRPADESHPYGHGKIESVSALIETGLLFLTSAWIIYEAIHRLLSNSKIEVEATWYAFAVVIVSIIIDISRSRALYKVAKATNSQALEADALHFSSDIYSSAAVLLGLVLVRFDVPGADAGAALVVAIFILLAGYRLGKRTIDVLVDRAPVGIGERAKSIAQEVPGVVSVESVRVRPLGPNVFIEMSVGVNRKFSLAKVNDILKKVERSLRQDMPEAEILLHPKSVQLGNESVVEAVQVLASKHGWTVHDVIVDQLEGNRSISYHLEVPETFTLQKAHDVATHLEDEIRKELGEAIEINSHLEPLMADAVLSSDIAPEELAQVMGAISKADQDIKELSDVDHIQVRRIGKHLTVSFHCHARADLPLGQVHEASTRFEVLVKENMRKIHRVVIHVEPK